MTKFVTQPKAGGLLKLSGCIENYKCTRARASFVFTEADRTQMGVMAVAAGLAGLGGQAISTAANAGDLEEEADYLEFTLNGETVKGWVWRSPFSEGDLVDIAATKEGDAYETFGIARPTDRTVALYPHCSRGTARHYLNAGKWWLYISSGSLLVFAVLIGLIAKDRISTVIESGLLIWPIVGFFGFFGAMVFSLSRKWLPFVRVAEKVFRTLDWPHPSNVDLKKRTKSRRTKDDSVEYGRFYFHY
ncbi:MAG: putative type VI secretion system effector [Rhodoferax sp.]|uniref:putative type VI secretion system effector n=1 Tax=Rhodoferax sp. TaxID=50421 RepID=UPI0032647D44